MRQRRACFGELEQMDGTDHDWFEGSGERCSLLVMIDDATGMLGALHFVAEESFFGYCALLRQYLAAHGRPAGRPGLRRIGAEPVRRARRPRPFQ